MTRLVCTALCIALVSLAGRAGAQSAEEQARVSFEQGVALYEEGAFEQAAIAFQRAYELKPSYKILYNIGQAQAELRHYAAALQAYTRYLAEGGDEVPENRLAQVKSEIQRLNALVGMIVIECPVPGAKVKVDNEVRGKTPLPGPIFVDIGKHEVEVRDGPDELLEEVVTVAGGQRVVVQVEVAGGAAPAQDDAAAVEPGDEAGQPEEEGEGPERVWTWVAYGVGGAAAIGAVVTGSLALTKEADVRGRCEGGQCPERLEKDFDSVRALGITTDVLIGVAAAGVVLGTVLYFVEPDGEDGEGVTVSAAPLPGGGALGVGGRF